MQYGEHLPIILVVFTYTLTEFDFDVNILLLLRRLSNYIRDRARTHRRNRPRVIEGNRPNRSCVFLYYYYRYTWIRLMGTYTSHKKYFIRRYPYYPYHFLSVQPAMHVVRGTVFVVCCWYAVKQYDIYIYVYIG